MARFRADVARLHAAAMRAFVRHVTAVAFPDVGAALACAPPGTRVVVRAHTLHEGAMLHVVWADGP